MVRQTEITTQAGTIEYEIRFPVAMSLKPLSPEDYEDVKSFIQAKINRIESEEIKEEVDLDALRHLPGEYSSNSEQAKAFLRKKYQRGVRINFCTENLADNKLVVRFIFIR